LCVVQVGRHDVDRKRQAILWDEGWPIQLRSGSYGMIRKPSRML
jgi:hypothetical protein